MHRIIFWHKGWTIGLLANLPFKNHTSEEFRTMEIRLFCLYWTPAEKVSLFCFVPALVEVREQHFRLFGAVQHGKGNLNLKTPGVRTVNFDGLAGKGRPADDFGGGGVIEESEFIAGKPASGKAGTNAVVLEIIIEVAGGVLYEEFHAIVFPYGAVRFSADGAYAILLDVKAYEQSRVGVGYPSLYVGL